MKKDLAILTVNFIN